MNANQSSLQNGKQIPKNQLNLQTAHYLAVTPYDESMHPSGDESFDDRASFNHLSADEMSSAAEPTPSPSPSPNPPPISDTNANINTNGSTNPSNNIISTKSKPKNTKSSKSSSKSKSKSTKSSKNKTKTKNKVKLKAKPKTASNSHKNKLKRVKSRKLPSSQRAKSAYASLSKQERREFRNAFRLFDKDDDGEISINSLKNVFERLNYHFTEQQLLKMIASIDDNGDGVIDINEFVLVMKGGGGGNNNSNNNAEMSYLEEIKEAFEVFDKDGDGSISIDELAHIMEALGEKLTIKDIVDMMFEADADGNGNIDFEEFQSLMKVDHVMFQYNDGTAIGSKHIHLRNRSNPSTPFSQKKAY